jgi:hypothetical protein
MGTFSVTFTLTEGSSPNVGGFNITGDPGDVSIATNVSRAALATGVTYNNVDDTLTSFTIASTGQCENSVTKNVISVTPTPTPTATPNTFEYTGSGRGDTESIACTDSSNNRTFYSDCDTFEFNLGCYVYTDAGGTTPLTGYNFVFMNGALWDISPVSGLITASSANQC